MKYEVTWKKNEVTWNIKQKKIYLKYTTKQAGE